MTRAMTDGERLREGGYSMRRFHLQRDVDETGVSGTGIVAEGVQLSSGKCVLTWLSPHETISVYASIGTIDAVHGHGGKTKIVWIDT